MKIHRVLGSALLCLLIFLSPLCAQPVWQMRDDFAAYAEGSNGEPHWEAEGIGFTSENGVMRLDAGAFRSVNVLRAAPLGKALAIEATVTVRERRGKEWKTAGIGLYLDERNYWHLAFVEAPAAQNQKHFVEMSEMLDGNWNAHGNEGTRLTTLEENSFEWLYGVPYRLRLSLSRAGDVPILTGEVFEGAQLRYRCVRKFDARAVDKGRPALTAAGFAVDYDDFAAQVFETAAEDPKTEATTKFAPFVSSPLSRDAKDKATGFFRVANDGRAWWIVDPNGKRTLSVGTDHVNYTTHWCEKLGYAPYHRVVEKKYGNAENWAKEATRRLRDWNFNVLGANNSLETRYQGLAHTDFIAFGSDFSGIAALVEKTHWTGFPDVFDPRFVRFCDLRAKQRCAPRKNDPWLLGYFLDNELEWYGKSHSPIGIPIEVAKLPATAAGKKAFAASLRAFYKDDLAAFNVDFATQLPNFDAILQWTELPNTKNERAYKALLNFVDEVARRYFEITTAAIRKYDPNHMIIGNRFAGDAPDAAWNWAGQTCDIVTVNIYPRANLQTGTLVGAEDFLRRRFARVQKPIIITEWSFPALDAIDSEGRPLPSKHGAGMRVDNQAQKARCYAIFQRTVLSLPFVVGSHYFMWGDEPALGISSTFPEDSNYGLVSESDVPYPELTQTATRINALMPQLHAGEIKVADVPLPDAPLGDEKIVAPVQGTIAFTRTENGFTLEHDALRLLKNQRSGAAFDQIFWREKAGGEWFELGSFKPLMHIVRDGQSQWVDAGEVRSVKVVEQTPQKLVLEMQFARAAAPSFSTAYRFTMQAGQPFFTAQCLWVENSGDAPWQLRGYYHYALPRLNGDASDDEPGGAAGVPNYYRPISAWRDKSGLQFGVIAPFGDDRFSVNFWKDAIFHADAWRKLEEDLAPGKRWNAATDEPVITVFGKREK